MKVSMVPANLVLTSFAEGEPFVGKMDVYVRYEFDGQPPEGHTYAVPIKDAGSLDDAILKGIRAFSHLTEELRQIAERQLYHATAALNPQAVE